MRNIIQSAYRTINTTLNLDKVNQSGRHAELLDQLSCYQSAIESSGAGIWDWTDLSKETIQISDQMGRLLGMTHQNSGLSFTQWYEQVHPKDRGAFLDAFYEHVEDRIPFDLEYRTKVGPGYRWMRATAQSVRDGEGKVLRMSGILQDVQDARQAQEKLDLTKAEMEDFVYSVAHDLRAPVRHITSFIEIMEEDLEGELSDLGWDYLLNIRQAADRLGRMIDDLLQVSRSQRLPLRRGRFSSGTLVERIVGEMIRQEPTERKIEMQIDTLPDITSDPNLLEVIWRNLLSNALKFTRDREIARIRIGHYQGEEAYTFFIADNGMGFDMAYSDKLFKFFHRLHVDDRLEGTGVGLASTARSIHRLGGEIWAEGVLDAGATFYFSIPLVFDGN